MGLIADILTSQFSQGMSQWAKAVTIVNVPGPFEPTDDRPAVMLVPGNLPGTVKAVRAVPAYEDAQMYVPLCPANAIGPMMNGAYIESSDSSLGEAVAALGGPRYSPVPLHDRFETPEQYRRMSA